MNNEPNNVEPSNVETENLLAQIPAKHLGRKYGVTFRFHLTPLKLMHLYQAEMQTWRELETWRSYTGVRLNRTEQWVLYAVALCSDAPTTKAISEVTNISNAHVYRVLNKLWDLGFVDKQLQGRSRQLGNVYPLTEYGEREVSRFFEHTARYIDGFHKRWLQAQRHMKETRLEEQFLEHLYRWSQNPTVTLSPQQTPTEAAAFEKVKAETTSRKQGFEYTRNNWQPQEVLYRGNKAKKDARFRSKGKFKNTDNTPVFKQLDPLDETEEENY